LILIDLNGAQGRNRTTDTRIFNHNLSPEKSKACNDTPCQTRLQKTKACETFVKPCRDDICKEKTGAAATAPGFNTDKKPLGSCRKNTTSKGKSAMSLYGKDGHKRIAKAVGFALTLGTTAAWHSLTILLLARLTEAERAGLAFSALRSLDEDNAYSVASLAIFGVSKGEVAQ
jgi:hypothetical protein